MHPAAHILTINHLAVQLWKINPRSKHIFSGDFPMIGKVTGTRTTPSDMAAKRTGGASITG
jgi:hypothetical protein